VSGGNLAVRLRQDAPVALDVEFSCAAGDVVVIFGPSGSGKTTILRSIAGLYTPKDALIHADGRTWTDTASHVNVPPHERPVGFVFQEYALFPHLTAAQNVQLALHGVPARERPARAAALLARVHLSTQIERRPHALSGGERQRVALARALAREPRALLLDEPFAAVDRPTRRLLRAEVDEIRQQLQVPTVLVTHDLEDVIRLATHLLVLERGRAVAFGPLTSLLARPDLRPLRDLVGLGSVVEAIVTSVDAGRGLTTLSFDGGTLTAPQTGTRRGDRVRVRVPAREVILADRAPEGLSLHNAIPGRVTQLSAEPGSPYVVVQLMAGATPLLVEVTRDAVDRLPVHVGRELFMLIKSVALEI
jgi:molybdate transport system ATP-binding protein